MIDRGFESKSLEFEIHLAVFWLKLKFFPICNNINGNPLDEDACHGVPCTGDRSYLTGIDMLHVQVYL